MLNDLFFERDVSPAYEQWLTIAEQIGLEDADPTAQEIWNLIRCSEKPPHIGNACMTHTLSAICSWCEGRGYQADYYVNAIDSHLIIDGEAIATVSEFWQRVTELDGLAHVS